MWGLGIHRTAAQLLINFRNCLLQLLSLSVLLVSAVQASQVQALQVPASRANGQPIYTLKPGQPVPDFSLPAANGWGQRLAEQRGSAVMLFWLDDCDMCGDQLVEYQLLAESLEADGLVSWFIWTPNDDDRPPRMRIPVLLADPHWRSSWNIQTKPAMMLITPDGQLGELINADLDDYQATEQRLLRWLQQQNILTTTND